MYCLGTPWRPLETLLILVQPMQSCLHGRPPYMKGQVVWCSTIPSYKLDTVNVWWYIGTIHHSLCISPGKAGDASAYI